MLELLSPRRWVSYELVTIVTVECWVGCRHGNGLVTSRLAWWQFSGVSYYWESGGFVAMATGGWGWLERWSALMAFGFSGERKHHSCGWPVSDSYEMMMSIPWVEQKLRKRSLTFPVLVITHPVDLCQRNLICEFLISVCTECARVLAGMWVRWQVCKYADKHGCNYASMLAYVQECWRVCMCAGRGSSMLAGILASMQAGVQICWHCVQVW